MATIKKFDKKPKQKDAVERFHDKYAKKGVVVKFKKQKGQRSSYRMDSSWLSMPMSDNPYMSSSFTIDVSDQNYMVSSCETPPTNITINIDGEPIIKDIIIKTDEDKNAVVNIAMENIQPLFEEILKGFIKKIERESK